MQDTDLYRHLLGLESPWTVSRVELDIAKQRVDVFAEHGDASWRCSECDAELALYDHSEERVWRHLDSCQFMTYLHARPPRVECKEHGVKQARLPWAEPRSRFTALFERFAIDVMLQTDVTGAMRILRLSWDEAWLIKKKAVARGQRRKERRPCPRIGVDEKAVAKGHQYLTLVCDLDRATVEYVAEDRKWESLDGYFKSLSPEQLSKIEVIATDMWDPFIKAIRENVPAWEKKLVYDRFHIMKILGHAVDLVRRQETRRLREAGDETLTGTRYAWLYAKENLPEDYRREFRELGSLNLKTARAWALKESLRELWHYQQRGWAERHWKQWYFWATHSRLNPMIAAARTMKRHLENILTYLVHRVTNAVSEGINSKIQTIKKMAYGFRNKDNFKTAIYFHCGGLDLYPATHAKAG